MNIPPYWAKAKPDASKGSGRKMDLSAWGWSTKDQSEAEAHARSRLSSLVARVEAGDKLSGKYGYGKGPLREEIVPTLTESIGHASAVVTRNAQGCLVLNTQNALFLDVDIPDRSMAERLRGLFGASKPSPETKVLARLREILQQTGNASFRIYRTAAGFRVFGTDPIYPQGDRTVASLLADPIVDRAYAKLCEIQQSYRARLTPKPWRCGCARPPARYPFANPSDKASYDRWLEEYEQAIESRATCALVEEVGWKRVSKEIAPLLALHDRIAQVGSNLPLA